MTDRPIAIYGAGGFAREVAWLAEECGYTVVCFIDDDPAKTDKTLNDCPVLAVEDAAERFPTAAVAAGIGDPSSRESVTNRARSHGFGLATLVHPRVEKSRWITIGTGVVICAGNILTTNIVVGDHVQINLDCTVGHDVALGEYATLAPGVHLSGCVRVGRRVYIGTGAVIINGNAQEPLTIGDDAIVGAAACVTRSVSPGATVVGVPAKAMSR
jgi:sugar O-acyltransferase (sialic acid O-acetyltransferase NeuD family)